MYEVLCSLPRVASNPSGPVAESGSEFANAASCWKGAVLSPTLEPLSEVGV